MISLLLLPEPDRIKGTTLVDDVFDLSFNVIRYYYDSVIVDVVVKLDIRLVCWFGYFIC